MALMKHREGNEIKWTGVRPAHRGTQILKDGYAGNETTVIHTVSVGKVFYMTGFTYNVYTGALANGYLAIRNGVDAIQVYLVRQGINTNWVLNQAGQFWPPLELPAGWDVAIISDNANLAVQACIWGWEE